MPPGSDRGAGDVGVVVAGFLDELNLDRLGQLRALEDGAGVDGIVEVVYLCFSFSGFFFGGHGVGISEELFNIQINGGQCSPYGIYAILQKDREKVKLQSVPLSLSLRLLQELPGIYGCARIYFGLARIYGRAS